MSLGEIHGQTDKQTTDTSDRILQTPYIERHVVRQSWCAWHHLLLMSVADTVKWIWPLLHQLFTRSFVTSVPVIIFSRLLCNRCRLIQL